MRRYIKSFLKQNVSKFVIGYMYELCGKCSQTHINQGFAYDDQLYFTKIDISNT